MRNEYVRKLSGVKKYRNERINVCIKMIWLYIKDGW